MPPKRVAKSKSKFDMDDDAADGMWTSSDEKDLLSPKKAKKEENGGSPGKQGQSKKAWNAWRYEEELAFIEALDEHTRNGFYETCKKYPSLEGRTTDGCNKHWIAVKRKIETALLGAPITDSNGRRIVKQDGKPENKPDNKA